MPRYGSTQNGKPAKSRLFAVMLYVDSALARFGASEVRYYTDLDILVTDLCCYIADDSTKRCSGEVTGEYNFKKIWESIDNVYRLTLEEILSIKKRGWHFYGDAPTFAAEFLEKLKIKLGR